MYGGPAQGRPETDGSFEMKGVSSDRFNLVWYNLPAGAYVKSARSDQVDVLASGLDTMITDQVGAFSLAGVPPGEYKAYAWEDIESGAWMDPDVLKLVDGKGESVTLREGDQKSLPLKLILADTGAN